MGVVLSKSARGGKKKQSSDNVFLLISFFQQAHKRKARYGSGLQVDSKTDEAWLQTMHDACSGLRGGNLAIVQNGHGQVKRKSEQEISQNQLWLVPRKPDIWQWLQMKRHTNLTVGHCC